MLSCTICTLSEKVTQKINVRLIWWLGTCFLWQCGIEVFRSQLSIFLMRPYEWRQSASAARITVSAEGVWQGGVSRNDSAATWSCIQVLLSVITVAALVMDCRPTVLGSQFLLACYMPAPKKFHFNSLLLCRRRQRGEIFPSEVLLQDSCSAKEELPQWYQ